MGFYRKERYDLRAIGSAKLIYELAEGQMFYETPKSYEIWDTNPPRRIERFSKKQFYLYWTN